MVGLPLDDEVACLEFANWSKHAAPPGMTHPAATPAGVRVDVVESFRHELHFRPMAHTLLTELGVQHHGFGFEAASQVQVEQEPDDVAELPSGEEKMMESKEGAMQADGEGATLPAHPPCTDTMESVEAVETQVAGAGALLPAQFPGGDRDGVCCALDVLVLVLSPDADDGLHTPVFEDVLNVQLDARAEDCDEIPDGVEKMESAEVGAMQVADADGRRPSLLPAGEALGLAGVDGREQPIEARAPASFLFGFGDFFEQYVEADAGASDGEIIEKHLERIEDHIQTVAQLYELHRLLQGVCRVEREAAVVSERLHDEQSQDVSSVPPHGDKLATTSCIYQSIADKYTRSYRRCNRLQCMCSRVAKRPRDNFQLVRAVPWSRVVL
ncbi:unnamed protein product [Prorocentrum cordatum]|uniref:Uncharacterized protein n=1 Tax=Prorocentrum cordatum TaxID=2364126 RepID=A0ABN9UD42_9DINO|nr:unnamed protein product [Polarella glacialis]